MAGAKSHQYHILPPSIWPFIGAVAALALFGGAVMWMHGNQYGPYVTGTGLIAVLFVMFSW